MSDDINTEELDTPMVFDGDRNDWESASVLSPRQIAGLISPSFVKENNDEEAEIGRYLMFFVANAYKKSCISP